MTIQEWVDVMSGITSSVTAICTLIPAIIAALVVVYGVNSWRRETVGKRRLDAGEAIMSKFYQTRDAIREIRDPWSSPAESSERERSDNESETVRRALDISFVVNKRLQSKEALFTEFRSLKYMAMSVFGPDAEQPFKEIESVIREIKNAAFWLQADPWLPEIYQSEPDRRENLKQQRELRSVIWSRYSDNDKIEQRVQDAVNQMESMAKIFP